MAITQTSVQKRQMEGSWSSTAQHNYNVVLQCLSNDPADGPQVALNAAANYLNIPVGAPIPVVYAIGNDFDPASYLKSMTARQTASGSAGESKEWLVTLQYDSNIEQQPDNPLQRPTQISGTFQEYQKAIWKDNAGAVIKNTANQAFDPPIELPDARPHLTMTRNETSYDMPFFATTYINRINSAAWYGGSAGQWRCVNVAGTGPHFENNVIFYTLTYEFQFHEEGWQPSIASRGKKQKDGTPCTDANGNQLDEGGFLDANGKQLAWPVDPTAVQFVNPNCFYTADFNQLGLP